MAICFTVPRRSPTASSRGASLNPNQRRNGVLSDGSEDAPMILASGIQRSVLDTKVFAVSVSCLPGRSSFVELLNPPFTPH